MTLNRTITEWLQVKPEAVVAGSTAQAQNVLQMAIEDISRLSTELDGIRADRDRIARNRDMWKAQCANQAALLHDDGTRA